MKQLKNAIICLAILKYGNYITVVLTGSLIVISLIHLTSTAVLLVIYLSLLFLASLFFSIMIRAIIADLKRKKRWALTGANTIMGLSIFSVFIIPAIIGLVNINSKEAIKEFPNNVSAKPLDK